MYELYFLGMDIVEETKNLVKFTEEMCTEGMTDSELKAYKLGIENVLLALKSVVETEHNTPVVNNPIVLKKCIKAKTFPN